MNMMRAALAAGHRQIGLWQALANPYTAEICAGLGFDWLMFDGEHGPNTLQTLLAQLHSVSRYNVEPVARPPVGEAAIIKQYLDIGFKTLLVPMVESAAQAEYLVRATRFPPRGIRGIASATSRVSGFGAQPNYLVNAHEDIFLIAQIESAAGLAAIDEIAATDGIDALFIGPSDLAGSLGHLGNPRHAVVQTAISRAISRIAAAGKPSGIFALDIADARVRLDAGVGFVSIGTDIGLLTAGGRTLLASVKNSEV